MAGGISTANFLDLLIDTLPHLPWDDTAVLLKQQQWPVCNMVFGNMEAKEGGKHFEIQVQYQAAESGGFINPAEVRTPVLTNTKTSGTLPFIYQTMDYSITEHELMANRGRSKICSHINGVRQAAWLGWCEVVEQYFWKLPDTSGNKKPYGLPYWLVPITSAQAATAATARGSHQGVGATGFSANCAGIDPATYTRWKSYNACWPSSGAEVTQEAKVRLAQMQRRLNFQAPKQAGDLNLPPYSQQQIFTDETVINELGKAAQNQNDSLGANVTAMLGNIRLNGTPVTWTPELDTADTANRGAHPLYQLNAAKFKTWYDPMMWLKERKPMSDVSQPDVATVYVDCKYQWGTNDRQKCGGLISWVA